MNVDAWRLRGMGGRKKRLGESYGQGSPSNELLFRSNWSLLAKQSGYILRGEPKILEFNSRKERDVGADSTQTDWPRRSR